MDVAAANTAAARALVRGLAAAGVEHACVTPGSRSTPLTFALAEQSTVRPWLHLDERSSAFFALGLAKATGRPVAVVCTSGTAAANFLPAAVEADLGRVPLVLCTSDRPPRLRGVGAPQAIAQVGMFANFVRWAADLPLPAGLAADELRFAQYGERAARAATGPLPGPVHLNVPFEEPLLAGPAEHPGGPWEAGPPAQPRQALILPGEPDFARVGGLLERSARPLIVAGPGDASDAGAITGLAAAISAPILADPLSGLRAGSHDRRYVCSAYDAVLRSPPTSSAPDAVLRFGAAPTSKALNLYLAGLRGTPQVLVDLPGGSRDFIATATHFVESGTAAFCEALAATAPRQAASEWARDWMARDRAAAHAMVEAALRFEAPFEGRIFIELQRSLPAGATIFAGNSMPVRDLDSFLVSDAKALRLLSNRGANGIDGVTSTALGVAAASAGPVVLVTGDISFYHDLGGLWAARRHGIDLSVVLVNNNGGGIFHYLPQAEHGGMFEEWFGTPPDLEFEHAVRMYGGRYTLARGWDELVAAVSAGRGLNVVELRTERAANADMHRQAWESAARAERQAGAVAGR